MYAIHFVHTVASVHLYGLVMINLRIVSSLTDMLGSVGDRLKLDLMKQYDLTTNSPATHSSPFPVNVDNSEKN